MGDLRRLPQISTDQSPTVRPCRSTSRRCTTGAATGPRRRGRRCHSRNAPTNRRRWRSILSATPEDSARTIPLPPPCVKALREYSERQAAERANAGMDWEELGLVFPTRLGTPMEPDNLRRCWGRISQAAVRVVDPRSLSLIARVMVGRCESSISAMHIEQTAHPFRKVAFPQIRDNGWSGTGSNCRPSAFQVNRAKRCADLRKRTSLTSGTALGGRCSVHASSARCTSSTRQDSDPTQDHRDRRWREHGRHPVGAWRLPSAHSQLPECSCPGFLSPSHPMLGWRSSPSSCPCRR
jgi:hypothetical protein